MKERSMKTPVLVLVLVLVLAEVHADPFETFKKKHIFEKPENELNCTKFMKTDNLQEKKCRQDKHVIITTKPDEVKNICKDGTKGSHDHYTSKEKFTVIHCHLIKSDKDKDVNSCKYEKEHEEDDNITVKCDNGEPVHLDEEHEKHEEHEEHEKHEKH
uniref:Ribonuclease A-domain domain-containing protein n=1 Tax=Neogobius melanostomus TaxID=47308 RepID=A0A8C6WGS6_9GOBI